MHIDASLRELWSLIDDTWLLTLPTGWMQGRSIFGGLSAAAMAALARRIEPDPQRGLRVASIQLLAPVVAGSVRGEAQVLRQGRNITFMEVRLYQADSVVARATFVLAKALPSTLDVPAPPAPSIPEPETLNPMPYIEGVVPEFTQHVDMRWADGHLPFSGSTAPEFTGAFRYRVPLGSCEGVLALLDTFPPPSLSMAKKPCPASTVSWTAHLIANPSSFDGWFKIRYATLLGHDGLHTTHAHLYDNKDTLVAWSEQLVALFE